MDSTTQSFADDAFAEDALTPTLVLLPGLDGTGKLFAEFLKVLDLDVSARVVSYSTDVPLGHDELESLVRAALPRAAPSCCSVNPFQVPSPFASPRGRPSV